MKNGNKPVKELSLKEWIITLTVIGIILFIISNKVFGYVYSIGTILYVISLFDKKSKFQFYSKGKKIKTILGYLFLAAVFFNMANPDKTVSNKIEDTTQTVATDEQAKETDATKTSEETTATSNVKEETTSEDTKVEAEINAEDTSDVKSDVNTNTKTVHKYINGKWVEVEETNPTEEDNNNAEADAKAKESEQIEWINAARCREFYATIPFFRSALYGKYPGKR